MAFRPKPIAFLAIFAAVGLAVNVPARGVEGPLPQELLADAYEKVSPAVCLLSYTAEITNQSSGQISKRNNNALGLIVSPDGLVMTHGHMVMENAQPFNIRVTVGQDEDEREYDAELLEKPDDVNIVFLQIQTDDDAKFPYVEFQSGVDLSIGEPVALVGILGPTLDFDRAIYTRRIGAILEKPRTTYAIDEAIVFGFWGAPVINADGDVVGVTGYDLSSAQGGDLYVRSGHPLVYQASLFEKYIKNPPSSDAPDEGATDAWLGIFTQPLTDDLADYWELPKRGGIVVSTVMPGSPADSAGLTPGDVIYRFNDMPVTAKLDREVLGFTKLVREAGPNETVEVSLYRGGAPEELTVTLGERPKDRGEATEYEDEVFGVTARELTTDVRIQLNLPANVQGVIIRRIDSGSPANLAQMQPGMIIMNFGGLPISSVDDYQAAVEAIVETKPEEISVFCRVGSATRFFRIEPRWDE